MRPATHERVWKPSGIAPRRGISRFSDGTSTSRRPCTPPPFPASDEGGSRPPRGTELLRRTSSPVRGIEPGTSWAGSAADEHLERAGLRRVPEGLVGGQDVAEGEPVGDELLDRELVALDQLEQHPEGRGVHETHADVDVVYPQSLQLQHDRLAVHSDVRHVATGTHQLRTHVAVSYTHLTLP